MANEEKPAVKTVNVRVLNGGPLNIEIEIPAADAKAPATRKYIVLPGMKDPASVRGTAVPESEWKLAAVKPMVKGLLDRGDLIASA